MGPAGVRIPDTLDDGNVAQVVQFLDGRGVRVDADLVVDGQDAVFLYMDGRPMVVVLPVPVRDDSVHEVVAAGELDDDQDWRLAVIYHVRTSGRAPFS